MEEVLKHKHQEFKRLHPSTQYAMDGSSEAKKLEHTTTIGENENDSIKSVLQFYISKSQNQARRQFCLVMVFTKSCLLGCR